MYMIFKFVIYSKTLILKIMYKFGYKIINKIYNIVTFTTFPTTILVIKYCNNTIIIKPTENVMEYYN